MQARNIIVVGASQGIGKELVKLLSQRHRVLAIARNIEKLEELQALTINDVKFASADISAVGVRGYLELVFKQYFNKIDIVINCAGYLVNKPILEQTEEDIKQQFETNVFGLIQVCQAAIPHMKKNGHIVNIGSMGGFQGSVKFPGLAAYSATKSAVAGFSECLAAELTEEKIQVNCLAIGAAQTEMLAKAFPGYEAPVKAEEMAAYIADFALNANQFINGKTIPVSISTP